MYLHGRLSVLLRNGQREVRVVLNFFYKNIKRQRNSPEFTALYSLRKRENRGFYLMLHNGKAENGLVVLCFFIVYGCGVGTEQA